MLTSDDRKEVDLHLQRGSIARGVFRDILELVIFKLCHNSMMLGGVLKGSLVLANLLIIGIKV